MSLIEELINIVVNKTGISKTLVKEIVVSFIDAIREKLYRGESVKVRTLGTFSVVTKSQRVGRNISTGEKITIPSKRALVFKPSEKIKEGIQ